MQINQYNALKQDYTLKFKILIQNM